MPVPAKAGTQHVRGGCRPPVRLRLRLRRELDPPGGGLHPPPARGGTPHRIPAVQKEGGDRAARNGLPGAHRGRRAADLGCGRGVGCLGAAEGPGGGVRRVVVRRMLSAGLRSAHRLRPMVSPTGPAPTGLMPCPPDRAPRHAPLAAPVACTGPGIRLSRKGSAQVRALIDALQLGQVEGGPPPGGSFTCCLGTVPMV